MKRVRKRESAKESESESERDEMQTNASHNLPLSLSRTLTYQKALGIRQQAVARESESINLVTQHVHPLLV